MAIVKFLLPWERLVALGDKVLGPGVFADGGVPIFVRTPAWLASRHEMVKSRRDYGSISATRTCSE